MTAQGKDLGVLDGPVMLFGGPYSNAQATRALLRAAHGAGVTGARMVCTGDVVAYCGAPVETVDLIRGAGCHVVAGNCELQLAAGADSCGCGFAPGTACDLLSAGWYGFANARIPEDQRDWMRGLPTLAVFTHAGKRYGVIHGGVRDVSRFLWPVSSDAELEQEWRAAETVLGPLDAIVAGHSGLPFVRDTARGLWINAGVIGMPPHDGGAQTRYAMLDEGTVRIHNLHYDASAAAAQMRDVGLIQGYEVALQSGYWPSEDVLPVSLRVPARASG